MTSKFILCDCPAGLAADPERHAPDCPGRSDAGNPASAAANHSEHGLNMLAPVSDAKAQGLVILEPTDATLDAMRRNGLSIDGDNAYKRDLLDCVTGALAFGKQRSAPPPTGHWLERFYEIGQAEADERDQLSARTAELEAQAKLLFRCQEILDPHRDAVLWGDVCAALAPACTTATKPTYFGIDLSSGPDVTIYDRGRCPTSGGCLGCCMKAPAPGGKR